MDANIRNLHDIEQAAIALFKHDRHALIWSAVEQVLKGIEVQTLRAIYRKSGQDWCLAVLRDYADDDFEQFVMAGVEALTSKIRQQAWIQRLDDARMHSLADNPRLIAVPVARRRSRRGPGRR